MEEDADIKADLHYKLAYIQLSQSKLSACRTNALKAAKFRSGWGEPYILIGKAYAAYAPKYGSKPIEKKYLYWLAVDKFKKAKAIDPECGEEARKQIATYSKHFPNKENAFFEGIKDGDVITVGGWVNETTKARLNE